MTHTFKKVADGLFALPDDSLERGFLLGGKCSECHAIVFPKRLVCPHCLAQDSAREIALSKRGTLYAYSVNQVAPTGFEAPYVTGKIDLPEKVRIFSVITGCEPREESLHIGMEMEIVFQALHRAEDGSELIGYAFRPRREDGEPH